MGTMIQTHDWTRTRSAATRFRDHPHDLKGANDLLVLTQPDIIRGIHAEYLAAGADIVSTDTFNANRISMADYALEPWAGEMNEAAARIARQAADAAEAADPSRPRFVAGSLGPTNRTASLSPDVNDPGARNVTWEELRVAYHEAAAGLVAGGADILLIETIFDTLNAKAAIFAVEGLFDEMGFRLPVVISGTITDASGRTLSGQTVSAFWDSVRHARPLAVGLNCALGARQLRPYLQELSGIADTFVSGYPNAGLPNAFGGYDEQPPETAGILSELVEAGALNLVGGCCGTTPAHIRAIAEAVRGKAPRRVPDIPHRTHLSGLESLEIGPESLFVNVGERTNVTGSRRFARLILDGRHAEAVEVARQQVDAGAQAIDINMDEALLDSEAAMTRFLDLIAAEPDISKVPVMLDSSRWSVLEAGLQHVQGRSIVNSLSLKEGEGEFLRQARLARRYGAVVVVMAFDEDGQAETVDHRVAIAHRVHRLLTEQAGFASEEIILDPNVFAIGTGIEEHRGYAVAFIEATRRIKAELPGVLVSGGVSNVSFSFRGNDPVREAIHAVFLVRAIEAGMDMGIVNAGALPVVDDLDPDLRGRVEDLVLDRREDATERLLEVADTIRDRASGGAAGPDLSWREAPVEERLRHALVEGFADWVVEDTEEARRAATPPNEVNEGPLMGAWTWLATCSARVACSCPRWSRAPGHEAGGGASHPVHRGREGDTAWCRGRSRGGGAGRVVVATVKGDVHDIGKNIVGVVLGCNDYEVIDLGVMVPGRASSRWRGAGRGPHRAVGAHHAVPRGDADRGGRDGARGVHGAPAHRWRDDLAGAHGGGDRACVSRPVVHVVDASRAVGVARALLDPAQKDAFVERTREEYAQVRAAHEGRDRGEQRLSLADARERRLRLDWTGVTPPVPTFLGPRSFSGFPLTELVERIDWSPFFSTWELSGRYPGILSDPVVGPPASSLFRDAQAMLQRIVDEGSLEARGVVGFWPAASTPTDDIQLWADAARTRPLATVHTLRQQFAKTGGRPDLALSDYVAPIDAPVADHLGMFAVSAGFGLEELRARALERHDDYASILAAALADRLAEAFAERMHELVRRELWGYVPDESLDNEALIEERYQGIRPAPGYPACPDHTEKRTIFTLLEAEERVGITLTESMAMLPGASVSGFYFWHPKRGTWGSGASIATSSRTTPLARAGPSRKRSAGSHPTSWTLTT